MSQIVQQIADPVGWLVLAGGGIQALAHLFKNQIVMRLMLLAGTMHYVAYYFAASAQPLWPAILATTALTLGAVIGLVRAFAAPARMTCTCSRSPEIVEPPAAGRAVLRVVEN